MLHVNNDVIPQNIVQRLLNEISVEQLKAIVEKVDNGVSIIVFCNDGSVQLAYANNRYYEIFGYTQEQFLAELKDPYDRIYPGDRKFVATMMRALRSTQQAISFQYRVIKPDKSVTYIRCSSSMSPLGKQEEVVFLSILNDVTDVVENEKKALITEQRLNAITQNIDDGSHVNLYDHDIYKCICSAKAIIE